MTEFGTWSNVGAPPPTITECSPPGPTCNILEFAELTNDGETNNRIRVPIGTNALGYGYETRVTILDASASYNYSADPIPLDSRLILYNYVDNKWFGNFLGNDNIGQSGFCQEGCEVRQWSEDGDGTTADYYKVMVEILPILTPCEGCTVTCSGAFSVAAPGCVGYPGSTNCVTVTIGPVLNDLTGSCTASGGANKIAVRLAAMGGISCGPSCTEQFLVNGNYLLGVRNPGTAFDDWLSPESVLTASFDLDGDYLAGSSFSIEIMAVFDEFLIDSSEFS